MCFKLCLLSVLIVNLQLALAAESDATKEPHSYPEPYPQTDYHEHPQENVNSEGSLQGEALDSYIAKSKTPKKYAPYAKGPRYCRCPGDNYVDKPGKYDPYADEVDSKDYPPVVVYPGSKPVDVCKLSAEVGPCKAIKPRYYYDSSCGECKKFNYGGCEGNGNNFITKEECLRECEKK